MSEQQENTFNNQNNACKQLLDWTCKTLIFILLIKARDFAADYDADFERNLWLKRVQLWQDPWTHFCIWHVLYACACSTRGFCGWGVALQAVISDLGAHHRRTNRALGWASGGRQVQGKINAICKVPFTQFQCWIVSRSGSRRYARRDKSHDSTSAKLWTFLPWRSEITQANRQIEN